MSLDFPAKDSPRCTHCKRKLVDCPCLGLKWDSMMLRSLHKGKAGLPDFANLPRPSTDEYTPGGEL